jgi:dynein heavy chain
MGGWSEMSSQELKDKLHLFLAATEVTMGQVKGETKLPLPPQDTDKNLNRRDKTLI